MLFSLWCHANHLTSLGDVPHGLLRGRRRAVHTNTHMKTFLSERDMGSVVMSYTFAQAGQLRPRAAVLSLYNRPPLSNNTCLTCQDPTPPIRQAEGGNRGLSLGMISCTVLCPQPSLLIMLRDRQKNTDRLGETFVKAVHLPIRWELFLSVWLRMQQATITCRDDRPAPRTDQSLFHFF